MLLSRMSIADLLLRPFAPLSSGGYAGLVFLVSRAADAPALHRQFFKQWADIHDLTRRYLAVITPDPDAGIILDELLIKSQFGARVDGVKLFGDEERLSRTTWSGWRTSVRMAAVRPYDVEEHQTALTGATTEMLEFFGLSESLLPCAVVVCLLDQTVCVVALGKEGSVYDFLKSVKVQLEPAIVGLRAAEGDLAAAKEVRNAQRGSNANRVIRQKAANLDHQWALQRNELAKSLRDVSARGPDGGELPRLCDWLSGRLRDNEALTEAERVPARELLRLLRTARSYGRLPRRVARTLARLNAGFPEWREAFDDLAAVQTADDAAQQRVGAAKAELDRLGREWNMPATVAAAAGTIGLVPAGSHGLLGRRELSWPIAVLARPERAVPQLRRGRG